jgi:hypothetical protein
MHGSGTCSECARPLTDETASSSNVARGCGICRACLARIAEGRRRAAGILPEPKKGAFDSMFALDGKQRPEYRTVWAHWRAIFYPRNETQARTYSGMPFPDAWNPNKGGSFRVGMFGVIADIGERAKWAQEHGVPDKSASLHIVDHAKGFVPGNLAWATKGVQNAEQMFKIIAKLRHENSQLKEENRRLHAVKFAA